MQAVLKRDPFATCLALPLEKIYPESQNPYARRLKTDYSDLVLQAGETEQYAGQWAERAFSAESQLPVELDLGCGFGHWLAHLAAAHPGRLFTGIDWTFKAIYHCARKLRYQRLSNARVLRANALRLPKIFGPRELSQVYLYFPDPWPRPGQAHKRLLAPQFLRQLAPCLQPAAGIWFKTDNDDLFSWGCHQIAGLSDLFTIEFRSRDLHADRHPAGEFQTLFEQVFLKQGRKIKFLEFRRKG